MQPTRTPHDHAIAVRYQQASAEVRALQEHHRISGVPVVERGTGRLVGIITNRDVRFATDSAMPVSALMTRDKLITVREGAGRDEARELLRLFNFPFPADETETKQAA